VDKNFFNLIVDVTVIYNQALHCITVTVLLNDNVFLIDDLCVVEDSDQNSIYPAQ